MSAIVVRPNSHKRARLPNSRLPQDWTFAIITTNANELVRPIHDRMPVIIAPIDYDRWLSPLDPDPHDLLVPFPSEPMTMWPISTRVNKPENDDPSILERVDEPVGIVAK